MTTVYEFQQPQIDQAPPEAPEDEQAKVLAKPDDDIIALGLAEQLKDRAAYFHSNWKIYEDGCWTERKIHEFRRFIRRELRVWRQKHNVPVNQSRIRALAMMLEDDLFIPDRDIIERQREQSKYINLRNGLFNLETTELEPHRPDLYFTTQLDFDYDEKAYSPTFRRYLNSSLVLPNGETDWSLIDLATEALAYSFTARTDLKASFWLVGQKDSGKSTFIAMIKALMGNLHATIDLTQLGINRFLLSGIVGKRVVSFTEATSSTVLPDALYKALVGGSDEIQADVKNRDPITFRPEAKIWWAMNEMPRISDRSGATTRRIYIFPFNRTIPEDHRISNLEQRLAAERSGIFNTILDALERLKKNGDFTYCEQSDRLRQEYIMENDTEATYLEERAELHESYRTQAGALYSDYSLWCSERGFKPKNYNQIAKEWRRFGFEHQHSNGKWWKGVRLRESKSI